MSNVDQQIFHTILKEVFHDIFVQREEIPSNALLTEGGDELITESGAYIVLED